MHPDNHPGAIVAVIGFFNDLRDFFRGFDRVLINDFAVRRDRFRSFELLRNNAGVLRDLPKRFRAI